MSACALLPLVPRTSFEFEAFSGDQTTPECHLWPNKRCEVSALRRASKQYAGHCKTAISPKELKTSVEYSKSSDTFTITVAPRQMKTSEECIGTLADCMHLEPSAGHCVMSEHSVVSAKTCYDLCYAPGKSVSPTQFGEQKRHPEQSGDLYKPFQSSEHGQHLEPTTVPECSAKHCKVCEYFGTLEKFELSKKYSKNRETLLGSSNKCDSIQFYQVSSPNKLLGGSAAPDVLHSIEDTGHSVSLSKHLNKHKNSSSELSDVECSQHAAECVMSCEQSVEFSLKSGSAEVCDHVECSVEHKPFGFNTLLKHIEVSEISESSVNCCKEHVGTKEISETPEESYTQSGVISESEKCLMFEQFIPLQVNVALCETPEQTEYTDDETKCCESGEHTKSCRHEIERIETSQHLNKNSIELCRPLNHNGTNENTLRHSDPTMCDRSLMPECSEHNEKQYFTESMTTNFISSDSIISSQNVDSKASTCLENYLDRFKKCKLFNVTYPSQIWTNHSEEKGEQNQGSENFETSTLSRLGLKQLDNAVTSSDHFDQSRDIVSYEPHEVCENSITTVLSTNMDLFDKSAHDCGRTEINFGDYSEDGHTPFQQLFYSAEHGALMFSSKRSKSPNDFDLSTTELEVKYQPYLQGINGFHTASHREPKHSNIAWEPSGLCENTVLAECTTCFGSSEHNEMYKFPSDIFKNKISDQNLLQENHLDKKQMENVYDQNQECSKKGVSFGFCCQTEVPKPVDKSNITSEYSNSEEFSNCAASEHGTYFPQSSEYSQQSEQGILSEESNILDEFLGYKESAVDPEKSFYSPDLVEHSVQHRTASHHLFNENNESNFPLEASQFSKNVNKQRVTFDPPLVEEACCNQSSVSEQLILPVSSSSSCNGLGSCVNDGLSVSSENVDFCKNNLHLKASITYEPVEEDSYVTVLQNSNHTKHKKVYSSANQVKVSETSGDMGLQCKHSEGDKLTVEKNEPCKNDLGQSQSSCKHNEASDKNTLPEQKTQHTEPAKIDEECKSFKLYKDSIEAQYCEDIFEHSESGNARLSNNKSQANGPVPEIKPSTISAEYTSPLEEFILSEDTLFSDMFVEGIKMCVKMIDDSESLEQISCCNDIKEHPEFTEKIPNVERTVVYENIAAQSESEDSVISGDIVKNDLNYCIRLSEHINKNRASVGNIELYQDSSEIRDSVQEFSSQNTIEGDDKDNEHSVHVEVRFSEDNNELSDSEDISAQNTDQDKSDDIRFPVETPHQDESEESEELSKHNSESVDSKEIIRSEDTSDQHELDEIQFSVETLDQSESEDIRLSENSNEQGESDKQILAKDHSDQEKSDLVVLSEETAHQDESADIIPSEYNNEPSDSEESILSEYNSDQDESDKIKLSEETTHQGESENIRLSEARSDPDEIRFSEESSEHVKPKDIKLDESEGFILSEDTSDDESDEIKLSVNTLNQLMSEAITISEINNEPAGSGEINLSEDRMDQKMNNFSVNIIQQRRYVEEIVCLDDNGEYSESQEITISDKLSEHDKHTITGDSNYCNEYRESDKICSLDETAEHSVNNVQEFTNYVEINEHSESEEAGFSESTSIHSRSREERLSREATDHHGLVEEIVPSENTPKHNDSQLDHFSGLGDDIEYYELLHQKHVEDTTECNKLSSEVKHFVVAGEESEHEDNLHWEHTEGADVPEYNDCVYQSRDNDEDEFTDENEVFEPCECEYCVPPLEQGPFKPFLTEVKSEYSGKICAVIDLDETLIHSSFKPLNNADFIIPVEIDGTQYQVYVLKRPHVDEFLKRMGELFECVLFTASLAKYADPVSDLLDKCGAFSSRLFRESCIFHQGNYVKDLSRLGRDLNKVIIVDNSPASYAFQPDNAVPLSSWFDDTTDTELLDLIPLFEKLSKEEDVCSVLKEQRSLS